MLQIFKRIQSKIRRKPGRVNHDFSDVEREKAKIAQNAIRIKKKRYKILNSKLNYLKEKIDERAILDQIADLEEDLYGPEDDQEDDMIEVLSPEEKLGFKLIESYLLPKTNAAAPQDLPDFSLLDQNQKQTMDPDLTKASRLDEIEIRDLVSKLPLSAKAYIKNSDLNTLNRAIELIRNEEN